MSAYAAVLKSDNEVEIVLAKSILEESEIPFIIKNAVSPSLFGFGKIGTGYNLLIGPVELLVDPVNSEKAKELFKDLIIKSKEQTEVEIKNHKDLKLFKALRIFGFLLLLLMLYSFGKALWNVFI
jgi:putative signal transducing protein